MEQWLARWAHNPKVGGSNPPPATSFLLFYLSKHQRRGIEQWLARRAHNPEVAGSNPVPATRIKAGSIFAQSLPALLYTITRKTQPDKTRTESKSHITCGLPEFLVLLFSLLQVSGNHIPEQCDT